MELIDTLLGTTIGNVPPLLLGLVFVAVFLVGLAGSLLLGGGDPVRRRLGLRAAAGGKGGGAEPPLSLHSDDEESSLVGLGRRFERYVASGETKRSSIRRRLVRAGYMGPSAVSTYYGVRLLLAIALPIVAMVVAAFVLREVEFRQMIVLVVFSGLAGLYLPTLWVEHRIQTRQRAARNGFPDALDMLLVCVEAGLSLDAATNRVATEIGAAHPILAEQFGLVALELRAGQTREAALRNLSERVGIQEAASLVTLLLQADALGTSIAQTLRVHADEIRAKRLIRAEEAANKIPVKLSIPLVLFILPALFFAVLTPAMIGVIRMVLPNLPGPR